MISATGPGCSSATGSSSAMGARAAWRLLRARDMAAGLALQQGGANSAQAAPTTPTRSPVVHSAAAFGLCCQAAPSQLCLFLG